MTRRTTIFIGLTVAVGAIFLAAAFARESSFRDLVPFVCYFGLALFTSSLKVRLPGITGTISVNFLFVLISIAVFNFTETLVLAAMACIVQCLWKARRRPRLIQVSFNVAALIISAGIAHQAAHALAGSEHSLLLMLTLAACFYFTSNTLLVSGVLSLIENKPLMQVWKQCYLYSFPYYLVGAVIAGLVVVCGQSMGWAVAMLILPVMYMVYTFYRICLDRLVPATR